MQNHDHSYAPVGAFERRVGIGGSDIGAILGLSPYRSAFDVWAEKTSSHRKSARDALQLRFGNHIEPFVAQEYERATGLKTQIHAHTFFHPQYSFLYGHIDRLVLLPTQNQGLEDGRLTCSTLLECKSASVYNRHEWGEPGTDEVPPTYQAQCAWYMAITQCTRVDIAVLLGNQDFRIYKIMRDLALEERLIERAVDFWTNHVLTNRPPKPSSADDIRTLYPTHTPELEIHADESLLEALARYQQSYAQASEISESCEAVKNEILIRMGEAEKITHNGKVIATWKSTKGTQRFDVKAMAREYPELLTKFSSLSAGTRRFVFKGLS